MATHSVDPLYSERVGDALAWAAQIHSRQYRKGKDEPYLSHILSVTALVAHYGGSEDQIIAAILHDSVEDAGGEDLAQEIGRRFGPDVERLVRECSDDVPTDPNLPKPPWRERKEGALAQMRDNSNGDAQLIEACDKLANLRDIVEDLGREPDADAFLSRFAGGADGVRWYYNELGTILIPHVPILAQEYNRLLAQLLSTTPVKTPEPRGKLATRWEDVSSLKNRQADRWKAPLFLVGLGLMSVLIVLELSWSWFRTAIQEHPLGATAVFAIAATMVGLGAYLSTSAIRSQRINSAATAVALGGLVQPMLGVELVLSQLLTTRREAMLEHAAWVVADGHRSPPLKWTRKLLALPRENGPATSLSDVLRTATIEPLSVADQRKVIANVLVDDCIREIVGSIRDWTDLLALTDSGQQALFALQSLRVDLQSLQDTIRRGSSSDPLQGVESEVRRLQQITLFLAVAFEDASFPKGRRPEVQRALFAPEPQLASVSRWDSAVVMESLARSRETAETQTRGARETLAWSDIEAFYQEQDQARLLAMNADAIDESTA